MTSPSRPRMLEERVLTITDLKNFINSGYCPFSWMQPLGELVKQMEQGGLKIKTRPSTHTTRESKTPEGSNE